MALDVPPQFVSQVVGFVTAGTATNPGNFVVPAPLTMRLASQQVPIRGVSVDAEFALAPITVYAGTSAYGIGYSVQPGSARAFGIEDSSAIFCVFAPPPGDLPPPTAGTIAFARITAYSFPLVSYGIATNGAAVASSIRQLSQEFRALRHELTTEFRKVLKKI